MTALYASLLRSTIAELDARAKTISPKAFVTLTCWPGKWQLTVWSIGSQVYRQFEGPEPQPLLDEASEILTEHSPDTVARTLGLELLATQS